MKYSVFLLGILMFAPFHYASAQSCIDTGVQGDGWGWDGQQSCRIDIPASECLDFDGDGWGWNGVASCRTDVLAEPFGGNSGGSTSQGDTLYAVSPTGQSVSYAAGDDADTETDVTPASRFTNNNNGTFTDTTTGLTWLGVRQCLFEQTWAAAINYANQLSSDMSLCTDLNDGSTAGEWRVPNINELQSLVDYSRQSPVFAAGIPFTGMWDSFPWGRYWSSTSFVAAPNENAWILNSDFGQRSVHNKADVARAFAVRN